MAKVGLKEAERRALNPWERERMESLKQRLHEENSRLLVLNATVSEWMAERDRQERVVGDVAREVRELEAKAIRRTHAAV